MLSGLELAWFRVFRDASVERETVLLDRKDRWGIGVRDDTLALRYQLADARRDHAARHLTGPAIVNSWSSERGDTTCEDNLEWQRIRTEKKRRAKRLLQPWYEAQEELAQRDAMGY